MSTYCLGSYGKSSCQSLSNTYVYQYYYENKWNGSSNVLRLAVIINAQETLAVTVFNTFLFEVDIRSKWPAAELI